MLSVTRPSAFTDPNQNKAIQVTPGPYCKDTDVMLTWYKTHLRPLANIGTPYALWEVPVKPWFYATYVQKEGDPLVGSLPINAWHHVVMTPHTKSHVTNGIILYLVDNAWLGIFQRIKIWPTKLLSQLRHNKLHISLIPSMSHWCLIDG